jgi:acyl-CoA thioester hydrolase
MPDPTPPRPAFPVSVEIPVAWGDMDAYQHVNNVVYLRWLETSRIAYFERLGLVEQKERDGVGPILARTAIDYRLPVTYPDRVRVDISVTRVGGSSFTMSCRVWSTALQAEVATAESVIVNYDYRAGRTAPIDGALRQAIAALEARAGGAA